MKKQTQTPEEAALKTLADIRQKKIDSATKDLNDFLKGWSAKHDSILVVAGDFFGNRMNPKIIVELNT